MRIAFLSLTDADFNAATPFQKPLGGTESAACYLAAALAQLGHNVHLFSRTSDPGTHHGVHCAHWDSSFAAIARIRPEFVIVLRIACAAHLAPALRPALCILWATDNHLQPSTAALLDPLERAAYAGFAMVSTWQLEAFRHHFGIPPNRLTLLRNAFSPSFQHLFADGSAPLSHKPWPPVLAYTSAPNRGLDLLLDMLPAIRAAVPGTTLRIHTTIDPSHYQGPDLRAQCHRLLQLCHQTPGAQHLGAVSQSALAASLKTASLLVYPNPNPLAETSCICLMEALAAGCAIVSSNAAALPETAAGFAELVPLTDDLNAYKHRFIQAVIKSLAPFQNDRPALGARLASQVRYSNESNIWTTRAKEWAVWLPTLRQPGNPFIAESGWEQWKF